MSSQYGVSIEETSAALAILASRGIEGTAAGTAFRNLVKELAAPATQRAAKSLEGMGIAMYDANGQIKPLTESLGNLAAVAATMSDEERIKWFESFTNERAAKALDALVMNMTAFKGVIEEVTQAQEGLGFVTEANARLMQTFEGQWKQLGADLQRAFASAYEGLAPVLTDLAIKLREVVNSAEFREALVTLANGFIGLTHVIMDNAKAIGLLLSAMAGVGVVKIFAATLSSLAGAFITLRTAMAAGSIWGTAVTAFAAANAGAGALTVRMGALAAILSGPLSIAVGATAAGIAYLALTSDRASSSFEGAVEHAKSLVTQADILADSARQGAAELLRETEALEEHANKLRGVTKETENLAAARSWAALETLKLQQAELDRTIDASMATYRKKYGKGWNEGLSFSESTFTTAGGGR